MIVEAAQPKPQNIYISQSVHLSKSITISQWIVCGNKSTAIALTGLKGSDGGIFLTLWRAWPTLLIPFQLVLPLHPPFPFSAFRSAFSGVHNSTALASKLWGLQDMYLQRPHPTKGEKLSRMNWRLNPRQQARNSIQKQHRTEGVTTQKLPRTYTKRRSSVWSLRVFRTCTKSTMATCHVRPVKAFFSNEPNTHIA